VVGDDLLLASVSFALPTVCRYDDQWRHRIQPPNHAVVHLVYINKHLLRFTRPQQQQQQQPRECLHRNWPTIDAGRANRSLKLLERKVHVDIALRTANKAESAFRRRNHAVLGARRNIARRSPLTGVVVVVVVSRLPSLWLAIPIVASRVSIRRAIITALTATKSRQSQRLWRRTPF
jgi:hypothetical protein